MTATDARGGVTTFTYDQNGNLTSLTDPLNHTTTWSYDDMDRVISRTDPLQRTETYGYDLSGNLIVRLDRKGQTTSFIYDALNRRRFVGFNVTGTTQATYESTVSYGYDAGSRLTQVVDSAGGVIARAYDDVNRTVAETTAQGSVTYAFDSAGRRSSMIVAGQPQVSYAYDNSNRLTQITQGSSSVVFGYDNANRRSSLTLPNGLVVNYSYDNKSHLTGITYQFGQNTLGNLTYSYDQRGMRTQVGGSFARTNLPQPVTSASYDAANELTNWNGIPLAYDANGNMLGDGLNTLAWNARNQVAALNGLAMQYDAFGRRTKNAAGKSFLYAGANGAQELSGSTVTANLWTGGIDELFQRSDSNGTVVPLTDALGSTIALVNSAGAVATTYSYDPFGNTTTAGATSANPRQYAGRENEGNGLYYYRARYYSPVLGRFVSQDPKGFGAGLNFYSYVGNNPISFSDPFGLDKGEGGGGVADCGDPQTICDSNGNCLFGDCMPVPPGPPSPPPTCEAILGAAECQWLAGQQRQPGDRDPIPLPPLPEDPPNPPYRGGEDPRIGACADVAKDAVGLGFDAVGLLPMGGTAKIVVGAAGTGWSIGTGDGLGTGLGAAGTVWEIAKARKWDVAKSVPVIGEIISLGALGVDGVKFGYHTYGCWF